MKFELEMFQTPKARDGLLPSIIPVKLLKIVPERHEEGSQERRRRVSRGTGSSQKESSERGPSGMAEGSPSTATEQAAWRQRHGRPGSPLPSQLLYLHSADLLSGFLSCKMEMIMPRLVLEEVQPVAFTHLSLFNPCNDPMR